MTEESGYLLLPGPCWNNSVSFNEGRGKAGGQAVSISNWAPYTSQQATPDNIRWSWQHPDYLWLENLSFSLYKVPSTVGNKRVAPKHSHSTAVRLKHQFVCVCVCVFRWPSNNQLPTDLTNELNKQITSQLSFNHSGKLLCKKASKATSKLQRCPPKQVHRQHYPTYTVIILRKVQRKSNYLYIR